MPASASNFVVVLIVMAMRASIMGSKFALAIFIAHYLDLSSLGLYGLASGAIAVVPAIVNTGMNHLLMRNAVTASTHEVTDSMRHHWAFVFSVYAILLTLTVVITAIFGTPVLWILIVAAMLFEQVGNDVFYLFSSMQHHVSANAVAFIRGAAWIFFYIPLAIWDPNFRTLPQLFMFWLAGGVLSMVVFVHLSWSWPWRAVFSLPFKVSVITDTLRKSLLFYVSDLGFVASQYVDRYLVSLFLGMKAAGLYFLFWTVANASTAFLGLVLGQKQRPLLITSYRTGGLPAHNRLTRRFLQTTVLASAVLGIAVGSAFQILSPWLKQASLAGHWPAFWLLVAGITFRYLADFLGLALFTAHRDQITTVTNVVSVFALVIAQVLFLPVAGLYGAGGAILITFGGISLWRYWLLFGFSLESPLSRQLRA
jgi:O-antigen/teichoic acid export membrane protein